MASLYDSFLKHAHELYPHLRSLDELRRVSDLTEPANWYVEARETRRRVIYHAGPTNSGKTYAAMRGFMTSSSGVYCGPLKLLAAEVFAKANDPATTITSTSKTVPCDLVTGEERRFASGNEQEPAQHVACTVEMADLDKTYECAVIDEIQMIGDVQRGWAWSRAFLGIKVSHSL